MLVHGTLKALHMAVLVQRSNQLPIHRNSLTSPLRSPSLFTRCNTSRRGKFHGAVSVRGLQIANSDILKLRHRLPQTVLKFRCMAWAACLQKIYNIHVEFADHCMTCIWKILLQGLDDATQRSSWNADCTVMHLHMHRHVTRKDLSLQCKTLLELL